MQNLMDEYCMAYHYFIIVVVIINNNWIIHCTNPKTLLTTATCHRDRYESKVEKFVSEISDVLRRSVARIFVQTQLQRNVPKERTTTITNTVKIRVCPLTQHITCRLYLISDLKVGDEGRQSYHLITSRFYNKTRFFLPNYINFWLHEQTNRHTHWQPPSKEYLFLKHGWRSGNNDRNATIY